MENSLTDQPNVKAIFVSSTFKDMQAERDAIRDRVLPEVADFAGDYGRFVDMIDLRWGVDTAQLSESESSLKVLNTCFEEIDRSRPYFIVLLGQRYGWVPDEEHVRTSLDAVGYQLGNLKQSVTALEIAYGAMNPYKKPVCFFYLRQPPPEGVLSPKQKDIYVGSDEEQAKLEWLKQQINTLFGDRVRTYFPHWGENGPEGLEAFAETMVKDITGALQEEWGEPPLGAWHWQHNEELAQASFAGMRQRRFYGRQDEVNNLTGFALHEDASPRMLMVQGFSGSGKSALMMKVAQVLQGQNCLVVPFACGVSPRSAQVEDLLRMLVWKLSGWLGQPESCSDITDFAQLRAAFFALLGQAAQRTRVVLVVDGLNQMARSTAAEQMLWLDGTLPQNVRVICSIIDGPEVEAFRQMGGQLYAMQPLTDADVTGIIRSLAAAYHKQVDSRVVAALMAKRDRGGYPAVQSPLALTLMVHELIMIDRYEHAQIEAYTAQGMAAPDAIARYMIEVIEAAPGDAEGEYITIINRIIRLIGYGFVRTVMGMLAFSRYGLREADLEAALGQLEMPWSAADFAWLRQLLREHMVQREAGQWDFGHASLRRALLYTMDEEDLLPLNLALVVHFMHQEDEFAQGEMMHHCWMAGRPEYAVGMIGERYFKWSTQYAVGLGDVMQRQQQMGPDINGSEDDFLLQVIRAGAELPPDELNRLGQFVHTELMNALPADTDMGYRVTLLGAAVDALDEGCDEASGFATFARCGCLLSMGRYCLRINRRQEALAYTERAVQLAQALVDARDDTTLALNNLALAREGEADYYMRVMDPLKAVVCYQKALEAMGKSMSVGTEDNMIRTRLGYKLADARKAGGVTGPPPEEKPQLTTEKTEEQPMDKTPRYGKKDDLKKQRTEMAAPQNEAPAAPAPQAAQPQQGGAPDAEFMQTMHRIAELSNQADNVDDDRNDEAIALMEEACHLAEGLYAKTMAVDALRFLAQSRIKLAQRQLMGGMLDVARPNLDDALEKSRALYRQTRLDEDRAITGGTCLVAGTLPEQSGDRPAALVLYKEAIEDIKAAYDASGHPEYLGNLCRAYRRAAACAGSFDDAYGYLKEMVSARENMMVQASNIAIMTDTFMNARMDFLEALWEIAMFLIDYEKAGEAVPYLKTRVSFYEMFYEDSEMNLEDEEDDNADMAIAFAREQRLLGRALVAAKQYEEAHKVLYDNCGLLQQHYERNYRIVLLLQFMEAMNDLAESYFMADEPEEGLKYHKVAYDGATQLMEQKALAEALVILAEAAHGAGQCLAELGQSDEARPYMEEALLCYKRLDAQTEEDYSEEIGYVEEDLEAL